MDAVFFCYSWASGMLNQSHELWQMDSFLFFPPLFMVHFEDRLKTELCSNGQTCILATAFRPLSSLRLWQRVSLWSFQAFLLRVETGPRAKLSFHSFQEPASPTHTFTGYSLLYCVVATEPNKEAFIRGERQAVMEFTLKSKPAPLHSPSLPSWVTPSCHILYSLANR